MLINRQLLINTNTIEYLCKLNTKKKKNMKTPHHIYKSIHILSTNNALLIYEFYVTNTIVNVQFVHMYVNTRSFTCSLYTMILKMYVCVS